MRRLAPLPLLVFLAIFATVMPAFSQDDTETAAAPTLAIETITLDPAKPGADTLVTLTVTVKNTAEQAVTGLGFDVTVGGVELPVYDNQLFVEAVEPKASTTIELFNFWTNETGRPLPTNGKLTVEVTLREAVVLERSKADDGSPVWAFGAPVTGLPVSGEVTVELAK